VTASHRVDLGRDRTQLALSGVYGVASTRTVGDLVAERANREPDRVFLLAELVNGTSASFTYSEVYQRSLWAAALLESLGVGRADRVHLHLSNRVEFLFFWFACAHLGAVMVPTNTASSIPEVEYIVRHARCKLSITEAAYAAKVQAALAHLTGGHRPPLLDVDELSPARGTLLQTAGWDGPSPTDDLAILYTSGTTARPKGVRLTHANYVYAGEVVSCAVRASASDRLLVALPLFHANAQFYSTMTALVSQASLVILPRFSATRYLHQARRYHATIGSLFAAPLRMILRQTPRAGWRNTKLRVVLFAQNLSDAEVQLWREAVGVPLRQLYGMTETVGPPLINPDDGSGRESSIGRPALGYVCRVIRQDGSAAEIGEAGELLVGGVPSLTLMAGYVSNARATSRVLKNGWLYTGDVVEVRDDGLFYFVDRRSDMIKRAGENVATSEVEAVLVAHPAIGDAAVIGVPDEIRDEQIVAYVTPSGEGLLSLDEIRRWCEDRLAPFRVPSVFELRSSLPRTAVGKIQKHVLRDDYLAVRASRPERPARDGS
jgi:crotonobetaine/carnitine-CoA ligase